MTRSPQVSIAAPPPLIGVPLGRVHLARAAREDPVSTATRGSGEAAHRHLAVLLPMAPGASARPAPEPWSPFVVAPYADRVATLDGRSQAEYLSPPGEYDYIVQTSAPSTRHSCDDPPRFLLHS